MKFVVIPLFATDKKASKQKLLARLRKFRGRMPVDFKFDRLRANRTF